MSNVFNKNCFQKKIKNPKYVGYRRYKRVFNYSVWVQVWCTEKKSQKIWQTSRADSRQNLMFFALEPLRPSRSTNASGVNTLASLQLQQRCSYADALLTRRSRLRCETGISV